MISNGLRLVLPAVVLAATCQISTATSAATPKVDQKLAERIVSGWPPRPRLGALQMIDKYGAPQEATSQRLVWHDAGPFKRITALAKETPHDFPLPHVDFLEHTISYKVPENMVGPLLVFDGSSTINRTEGELSARCDLEAHNILTLNLDHDIVKGKSVAQARKEFGEIVGQEVLGKRPAYTMTLQFQPMSMPASMFSDTPVMPGAPLRADDPDQRVKQDKDAEILATVLAVDMNEIGAAAHAGTETLSPAVAEHAKMLHLQHGENADKTMKLALTMKVVPVNTPAVDKLRVKGAAELAAMVPLQGRQFERAYLAGMVKGHAEVVSKLDLELIPGTTDAALKAHLIETRKHVAMHLAKGKELQGGIANR